MNSLKYLKYVCLLLERWLFVFLIAFTTNLSEWRWDFLWQKKNSALRIAWSQSEVNSTGNNDVFVPESVYAKDFAGIAMSQEDVK